MSSLGVVPTNQLLKDIDQTLSRFSPEAKKFLEEYNYLLEDDSNEFDRLSTLVASASSSTSSGQKKQNKQQQQQLIPLSQYMLVPLSFVTSLAQKKFVDVVTTEEAIKKYFASLRKENDEKNGKDDIEERFKKLYPAFDEKTGKAYANSCLYSPLQIMFRKPLPTTTAEDRRKLREKFKVARAHQEREAYNRMLKGTSFNMSSSRNKNNSNQEESISMEAAADNLFNNIFFKNQSTKETDPAGYSKGLRLKASSGGAGFLARDAFSSSSRQEMESIDGIASHDSQNDDRGLMKKISQDIGLGLDVPLMALAGAVVGWYACALRGYSSNESAIGAAICATIMLMVDGGLVMMKLAKEDLRNTKEKQRRQDELQKAVKASMGGEGVNNKGSVSGKNSRVKVLKREVLGEVPFGENITADESKKDK